MEVKIFIETFWQVREHTLLKRKKGFFLKGTNKVGPWSTVEDFLYYLKLWELKQKPKKYLITIKEV